MVKHIIPAGLLNGLRKQNKEVVICKISNKKLTYRKSFFTTKYLENTDITLDDLSHMEFDLKIIEALNLSMCFRRKSNKCVESKRKLVFC